MSIIQSKDEIAVHCNRSLGEETIDSLLRKAGIIYNWSNVVYGHYIVRAFESSIADILEALRECYEADAKELAEELASKIDDFNSEFTDEPSIGGVAFFIEAQPKNQSQYEITKYPDLKSAYDALCQAWHDVENDPDDTWEVSLVVSYTDKDGNYYPGFDCDYILSIARTYVFME